MDLFQGVRVYCCYNSRNDSDEQFEAFLCDLERSIRSAEQRTLVIVKDLNAWSFEWGSEGGQNC